MLTCNKAKAKVGGIGILLSVRPKYAKLIVDGTKTIELRKVIPKHWEVNTLAIYASLPIQRIIAVAEVDKCFMASKPEYLWETASNYGCGISKKDFLSYFGDKNRAYGLTFKNIRLPIHQIKLDDGLFKGIQPPQSFCYLTENQSHWLNHEALGIPYTIKK